jgi:ATP-binding cassette, subfamily B, bacterial
VIAHRLSTIRNAHHIYLFDNGEIIEQGTHATLISKQGSRYQEMFKVQQNEHMDRSNDDGVGALPVATTDEQETCKSTISP